MYKMLDSDDPRKGEGWTQKNTQSSSHRCYFDRTGSDRRLEFPLATPAKM